MNYSTTLYKTLAPLILGTIFLTTPAYANRSNIKIKINNIIEQMDNLEIKLDKCPISQLEIKGTDCTILYDHYVSLATEIGKLQKKYDKEK